MKLFDVDVNKINCRYFSRGAQLNFYKEEFLDLLPGEKVLFPKHIGKGLRVLDVGCGAGRTTAHIGKVTSNVVGIDLSDELVAAAREKHPDIEFKVMDAGSLDFPDATFDVVVFSNNGLCYVHPEEKRIAAVREMARVLKKGGIAIMSSFNRPLPLALHALVNVLVTKVMLGFSSRYKIHVTRYGITVNYETTPEEEIALFRRCGLEVIDEIPMPERLGLLPYTPPVLTYYAFRKL
jgi:ubiquinone/menaquinone biosynthesis C-methylase UbiE